MEPDQQDEVISPVKTVKDFHKVIEDIVSTKKIDYMEAVLLYCAESGLEVEVAGQLIRSSAKMKALIQTEAENLNYLPKSAKLPLSDDE